MYNDDHLVPLLLTGVRLHPPGRTDRTSADDSYRERHALICSEQRQEFRQNPIWARGLHHARASYGQVERIERPPFIETSKGRRAQRNECEAHVLGPKSIAFAAMAAKITNFRTLVLAHR
jgi:hypothetical protein